MARSVSADVQEQLYNPQTSYIFLPLAKIEHPSLGSDIFLVSNNEDILSNGDTYLKTSFDFIPPDETSGTPQNAKISIDGVDRSIIEVIQTIDSPATITISVIEANSPDVVEVGPWEFELRNVGFNASKVTGDLIFQTYLRDNVSTIGYRNSDFPGLRG